ncbi:MAG: hypothetical protein ACYCT9_10730, partial [Leptospirillum sp.]
LFPIDRTGHLGIVFSPGTAPTDREKLVTLLLQAASTPTDRRDLFPIDRTGRLEIVFSPGTAPTDREKLVTLLLQAALTPTDRRDPFPIDRTGRLGIALTGPGRLVTHFLEKPQGNDITQLREVAKELDPIIQATGQHDVPDKVQGRPEMANPKQGALNRFISKKRKNSWFDHTPLLILFPFP